MRICHLLGGDVLVVIPTPVHQDGTDTYTAAFRSFPYARGSAGEYRNSERKGKGQFVSGNCELASTREGATSYLLYDDFWPSEVSDFSVTPTMAALCP